MARTYKLVQGASEINLINTGATGWIFERGGGGRNVFPIDMSEGNRIAESYRMALKGSSMDGAASDVQTFIEMLRDAYRYHTTDWQDEPVYLVTQATNESKARNAMVYASPELEFPDLLDKPFEIESNLEGVSLTIIREHPWSSQAPGSIGSAITLAESDGPATPKMVHVANFRDDGNLTHVFVDDGGAFGSNIISAAASTDLFPAAPAVNDALYIGSTDIAFKHACLGIEAGDFDWSFAWEVYVSGAWTSLTYGTDWTLFHSALGEITSAKTVFQNAGLLAINLIPNANWQKTTINGVNAYWLRIRITSVTSTTSVPAKDASAIYAQRSNYVEIPAASLKGDSPPLSIIRMWTPSGGGSTVSPANLSRILVGARSEVGDISLDSFEPMLNCGNADNPAGWSTSYGDDTSAAADEAAPGNAKANCTFAGTSTMAKRVTLLGDDLLDDYRGVFRLLVGLEQSGGSAGDVIVKGRTFVGGSGDTNPHIDTRERKTRGVDKGFEVLDLGFVRFPMTRAYDADALASTDIGVEIHAELSSGSATVAFAFVMLLPILEGSVGVDDPVSDISVGSSALRGGCVLDMDSGLIADRDVKYIYDGTNLVPAQEWDRFNRPIPFEKTGAKTRLYFLMLHYATGNNWNTEPLIASLGCHIAVEIFMAYSYAVLRGND